jgi:protein phosphatase 1 regulatory subunit 7
LVGIPPQILKELEELDLYDNRLDSIDPLCFVDFKKKKETEEDGEETEDGCLRVLDLSFNLLKSIESLGNAFYCRNTLQELYLCQNKISSVSLITALGHFKRLKVLELGANRLSRIEGLEGLVELEELYLGKNKISKLEGLDSLKKLRILSIQSNRLLKIEGLQGLEELEELYMSHNGLERLENLEYLSSRKLKVLDVGNNKLRKLEGLQQLENLEEFWGNNNQFESFQEIQEQMGKLKNLQTVYFEGCSQLEKDSQYRLKLKLIIPSLKQIDATFIRPTS